MDTLFLLLILTKNGAGDINASFINTQTLQQCQQKSLMLTRVFKAASISLLESFCSQNTLQFSKFTHASKSRVKHHFYFITTDGKTVDIEETPDMITCKKALKDSKPTTRSYCSSSAQAIKNNQ